MTAMWKYRSEAIFVAAIAFAIKTAVHSDPISLTATIVFLACHYVDRYLSADRIEAKMMADFKALEDGYKADVADLRNQVTRIGLTMGIRGGNK